MSIRPSQPQPEAEPEPEVITSVELFHRILDGIENKEIIYDDWKDQSRHPSYTKFKVPYHMQCRDRYVHKKKQYENQFQHEICQHIAQQATAYEAARLYRHLCYTTLWPPLHNLCEIKRTSNGFYRLTEKQRERLNYLMNTKIIS